MMATAGLPPLNVEPVYVSVDYSPDDQLFFTGMNGVSDRIAVRRRTAEDRVHKTAEMVNASTDQWIVWCGLNSEADMVTKKLIPDAVNVQGQTVSNTRSAALRRFRMARSAYWSRRPRSPAWA